MVLVMILPSLLYQEECGAQTAGHVITTRKIVDLSV